jgi:protein-S-isoprenylcysteine O-methyltransferase Ste14
MSLWYSKIAVLVIFLGIVVIRAPHGSRSRKIRVVADRRGRLETGLLAVAWLVTILPLVWLAARFLSFADYTLHPFPYALGVALLAAGLWLFHRSHADLGTNWSITLQVRENHRLVTSGVYARVRHPMYSALFLLAAAQALVLPNWIAGPAYLFGFGLLYVLRVSAEERMMLDRFGADYEAYIRRSGRLIPKLRAEVRELTPENAYPPDYP